MEIAIGAIFRNEKEYIIEWLAWHISQGFKHFIIYDNESDDGTTALLQNLEKANLITLRYIERKKQVQLAAYEKILDEFKEVYKFITFIDADEFLMPLDNMTAQQHIQKLFKNEKVGAVGINWRVYGTNGFETQVSGPVTMNYVLAGNDTRLKNHYIKSVYRTDVIKKIFPHRANIDRQYRYINAAGEDLVFATPGDFSKPLTDGRTSGASLKICNSHIRVNHYALKSVEEFETKKRIKGDAMAGPEVERSRRYFMDFNVNDEEHPLNPAHQKVFLDTLQKLESQFPI